MRATQSILFSLFITLIPTSSRPIRRFHPDSHNNMSSNAPRSYATALRLSSQRTRGRSASHRFTPTLFQAEHSFSGTDAEGKRCTLSGRPSAVPQTSSKRPTSRATLNDSFVTQKQSSMLQTQAGQAEPPRCITDFDWPEPERRISRGGEPSKQQASFAPTEYMSPSPNIPAHHELGSVSLSCSDDAGPKDSASTRYDKPPPSATGHSFQPAVSFVPGSMTSLNPRKSQRTLTAGDELDMKRWYGA